MILHTCITIQVALERVAGCWIVRARANPLSLEVWHFTLRCILRWSWVGYPRPKGCCAVALWTQSLPKAVVCCLFSGRRDGCGAAGRRTSRAQAARAKGGQSKVAVHRSLAEQSRVMWGACTAGEVRSSSISGMKCADQSWDPNATSTWFRSQTLRGARETSRD